MKLSKKQIRNLLVLIIVGVVYYYGVQDSNKAGDGETAEKGEEQQSEVSENRSNQVLQEAYENRQSDVQIQGSGIVIKILPDDLEGSRHQKFILKVATGQKLLVAHNIDLAPRIHSLQEGDRVDFYGEYEWNAKGGVIHWTHHDPRGRHIDGWLKHEGERYE